MLQGACEREKPDHHDYRRLITTNNKAFFCFLAKWFNRSFQCDTSVTVVVLFVLCISQIFVLFEPHVRFHSFISVRVAE